MSNRKCSVCSLSGHNSRTCSKKVVSEPVAVPVVEVIPEPVPAPVPARTFAEVAAIPAPVHRVYVPPAERQRIIDYEINELMMKARMKRSSFLWNFLRPYYVDKPEMFRRVNDSHRSNGETEEHFTMKVNYDVKHTFTGAVIHKADYTFHVYFEQRTTPTGKPFKLFKRMTLWNGESMETVAVFSDRLQ